MEVIGRAVKNFLYQDITPFALAGSSNRWKPVLVDRDSGEIVVPDKGLNDPRVVGFAPKELLKDKKLGISVTVGCQKAISLDEFKKRIFEDGGYQNLPKHRRAYLKAIELVEEFMNVEEVSE